MEEPRTSNCCLTHILRLQLLGALFDRKKHSSTIWGCVSVYKAVTSVGFGTVRNTEPYKHGCNW